MEKMKHIAQSGKKQGQWVDCNAKIRCQNGGVHITRDDLARGRDLILAQKGVNHTSLARVPLAELRRVLHKDLIRPNNLPVPGKAVTVKPVPTTPEKEKTIKHFNKGSSFVEIIKAAYNLSDYKVVFPFEREISFDKDSETERKEVVAFLRKSTVPDPTRNWRLLPIPYEESGRKIRVRITDQKMLEKWVPAEARNILAWAELGAKTVENQNKEAAMAEYREQKADFVAFLKDLGVKEILD